MKAVPYIETRGSEKYRDFLRNPFNVEQVSWFKNIDPKKITFDGASYSYNKTHFFPLPSNLNEFISDMKRIGVFLEWEDTIIGDLEPQDYLPENEIVKYYSELLNKMEKGHELNVKE